MVERSRLQDLLADLKNARVAVIGDFAIDGYWQIEMVRAELSRETPHYTRPVVGERYSLGAAGNVTANLVDLGCGTVRAVTVAGTDWRGEIMLTLMAQKGIDTAGILRSAERSTTAFLKPMLKGFEAETEDARFDFENAGRPGPAAEKTFIGLIGEAVASSDAVIICDQVRGGVISDAVITACSGLARSHRDKAFFADSRYRVAAFKDMILKPNEIEACAAVGIDCADEGALFDAGEALKGQGCEAFITAGPEGVYYFGQDDFHQPGFPQEPPLDIVGAGDTFVSALAAVTAAGGSRREAALCACLASSITVKKLKTTGTASPAELLARYDEVNN